MITYARQAGAALLLAALAGAIWYAYRQGAQSVQTKFDAYITAAERAAVRQTEQNRDRAIEVEERVVFQNLYRDRFITKTAKEIERVTEPLAACAIPPAAVGMLNDAAACAREDRPASCGADDSLPGAQ